MEVSNPRRAKMREEVAVAGETMTARERTTLKMANLLMAPRMSVVSVVAVVVAEVADSKSQRTKRKRSRRGRSVTPSKARMHPVRLSLQSTRLPEAAVVAAESNATMTLMLPLVKKALPSMVISVSTTSMARMRSRRVAVVAVVVAIEADVEVAKMLPTSKMASKTLTLTRTEPKVRLTVINRTVEAVVARDAEVTTLVAVVDVVVARDAVIISKTMRAAMARPLVAIRRAT